VKSFNLNRIARTLAMVAVAGLATAASVFVASPAQAETAGHCMVVLPNPVPVACFDTDEQAMKYAESLGALIIPGKGGTSSGQATRSAAAALVGGLTLIGKEYPGSLHTGISIHVYGTNGPCTTTTTDIDYQLPDWGMYGFDQRISSFKTFGNCYAKHYDLVNYGGYSVGYQPGQAVMNATINDDTSSERWS
jgi:hypothetical protein